MKNFRFLRSLRAQVAFGVALPIFFGLLTNTIIQYNRERQHQTDYALSAATQLGQILTSSLNHSMMDKDPVHMADILEDVSQMDNIERVQIIGASGKVLADSRGDPNGRLIDPDESGCSECHNPDLERIPTVIEYQTTKAMLRISAPVDNQPACATCHITEEAHLGMVLIDNSFQDVKNSLVQELQNDLLLSLLWTIVGTLLAFFLVHWLVVRRVEAFRKPLEAYASGDLSVRIQQSALMHDELCDLADTFNQMVDDIDRHSREREALSQFREQAIIEERERIARELHDGIAQVLGYVNTKAMAVRLNLEHGELQTADTQLSQLEDAARAAFIDVREAILGLKMAGQSSSNLHQMLTDYIDQFCKLSDLVVTLDVPEETRDLTLPAETVLQLTRIVQESLSNTRKHAGATHAHVKMAFLNNSLHIDVMDNGRGFDRSSAAGDENGGFGLSTMHERAGLIGANLDVSSRPGIGTTVAVKYSLDDDRREN